MKPITCPRCNNISLVEIADGIYQCSICGYKGGMTGKSIFKT